jgi:hypothetical protein
MSSGAEMWVSMIPSTEVDGDPICYLVELGIPGSGMSENNER